MMMMMKMAQNDEEDDNDGDYENGDRLRTSHRGRWFR